MSKHKIISLVITAPLFISVAVSANNIQEEGLPLSEQEEVNVVKPLPLDWQKKVVVGQVLDVNVYNNATVILKDNGVETLSVDGQILRVLQNTHEVLEILQYL